MPYSFGNIKVLIIEDNAPVRDLIKISLQSFGIRNIFTADNGIDVYLTFCQERPDLVFADWEMEPMNGLQFTKKVRTDPNSPNPYVPIILITGYSHTDRVVKARDIGITEFLSKPFKPADLYKKIENVIERPRKFVFSDEYTGPDRRRRKNDSYRGNLKREDDAKEQFQ